MGPGKFLDRHRARFLSAKLKTGTSKAKAKAKRGRVHRLEQLESRLMLDGDIRTNVLSHMDVNDDGRITLLDPLLIINQISRRRRAELSPGSIDLSQFPVYFTDVNCSGTETPLDGLLIVNALARRRLPLTWSFSQSGGSSENAGTFEAAGCFPRLIEGDSFTTELHSQITLPNDSSSIEFTIETPQFADVDGNLIRDAVEIAVLDAGGQPVVLPIGTGRDAVLNWTSSLSPAAAPATTIETTTSGRRVTVNLSGLEAGSDVTLVARLVNNDRTENSTVVISRPTLVAASSVPPGSATPGAPPIETRHAVDLRTLQDVSTSLKPHYGQTSLNEQRHELSTQVVIQNLGSITTLGSIVVAIGNLSDPSVAVLNPDGRLDDGRPYFMIEPTSLDRSLGPDQVTGAREIRFRNPTGERFTYTVTTLARPNASPLAFTSIPITAIEAGRRYEYRATTSDPDGQSLTYRVITGPEGLTIDPQTGVVIWQTAAADLGSHGVILQATDPHGLFVEHTFDIAVIETLQNRPPMFVSQPETEAIAAGAFDVITLPTGEVPAGLAVGNFAAALGGNHLSLVAINQASQTISMISQTGPEAYGDTQMISVGEPPIAGDLLRTVLDIDLGLPAFASPTYDRNRVMGLIHGDFNGDGNLDVATSIVFSYRTVAGSDFYERHIAINLGRGDGTFDEAARLVIPGAVTFSFDTVGAVSLHAHDFDEDGTLDLLALDTKTNSLLFYRGLGDGSFGPAVVRPTGTNLASFKVYDVNGDGHLDLVAMRSDTAEFGIMLGAGDGTFADYASFTTHSGGTILNNYAVGDLNGDGILDFVSGNHPARVLNVYLGNGDGTFNRGVDLVTRGTFSSHPSSIDWSTSVAIGDFSGNGHADIAYTTLSNSGFGLGFGGAIAIYAGDGGGSEFTWSTASDLPMSQAPSNMLGNADPIDINGDGHLDLVFAGPGSWGNYSSGAVVAINQGDGTFTSKFWIDSNLGTHAEPNNTTLQLGVLVGDFNRDGMLDLLTGRSGSPFQTRQFASVSLMLADTPETYRAAYDTRLRGVMWGSIQFVEAADFNNDGILDLWGPGYQNPSFTQLGNGDGSFGEPFTATPNIGNEGLGRGFVADLDLDGNLDIVWYGAGGIQGGPQGRYLAALGNGDGTFQITYAQTGNNTPSGYAPLVIEPADFDGDGYMDFAAITGLGTIEIMRGVPEVPGTFARVYSVPISTSRLTPTLSAGDYDGDGVPDLTAVLFRSDFTHELLFFKGNGDGTLADPTSVPFFAGSSFQIPRWISSGDLNGDGHLDMVINGQYHRAAVLLGNGDGTFLTPTVYEVTTFNGLERPRLVDVNGDGHLDLVSANDQYTGPNAIEIRYGRGDGTFGDRQFFGTSEGDGQFVVGDFDNDGRIDLGINGRSRQDSLATFLGSREGLRGIATTDINGDGRLDIVAINHDNSHVKRLLGDGRGGFDRLPDLLVGPGPVDLLTSDFDGDGLTDFLTVNRSGRSISVMMSDGSGSYSRQDIPVGRLPIEAKLAKVTGDEFDDLLVIDAQLNALFVLAGDATGSFADSHLIPLGDRPGSLEVADIDGDGNLDVVIALPESNRLMILSGDGAGHLNDPIYVSLPSTPGKLAAEDLNGDGRIDLAVTLPDAGEVALLFGMGQRRFTQPQRIRVGERPDSILIADANGDGRRDVLVTNSGDNTASVILNRFDPDKVYHYDALAIDPDDDPVTYSIVEGPGGMILDPQTGEIRWAPTGDQVGSNRVVIEANDGRGGIATQEFTISVEPARTNAGPVITTVPAETISASDTFRFSASATDPDGDRLRYRLIEGPEGATVDPISGQVFWDPRWVALSSNRQFDRGYTEIPHNDSQNVESLTIEGWFRFASTTGNQVLIEKTLNWASPTFYTLRYFSGVLQLLIGDGTAAGVDTLSVAQSFQPEQWVHLGATFDDATGEMALLVNGNTIASKITAKRIGTAGASIPLFLGNDVYPFTGDVYGLRLWSEARTSSELIAGMHQPFESNTPKLFADYRFNEGDSLSVLDHSSGGNRGIFRGVVFPNRISGLAPQQTAQFTIGVEDGKGGDDRQTFTVTVKPQLRGSIVGTVFRDDNADGSHQAEEPTLSNWIVFIDANGNGYRDPSETFTTTDGAGFYQFTHLVEGVYPIAVETLAGFAPIASSPVNVVSRQTTNHLIPATALSGGVVRGRLTHDSSNQPLAHYRIFADLDRSGLFDAGEPTAITDRFGNYAIAGLAAGSYSLRVTEPAGWHVTSPVAQNHDIVLTSGSLLDDLDFAIAPRDSLAAIKPQIVTQPKLTGAVGEPYRYAVAAISPDGRPITYSLSLAPAGMVIDAITGQLAWTPNGKQTGNQQVILRAATDNSSVDLQGFTIEVAPANSPPIVVSQPSSPAAANTIWVYQTIAQDAEQRDLRYDLALAPSGATIDPNTGLVRWTPQSSQLGGHAFSISVDDQVGGVTLHSFTLDVVSSVPTTLPFNIVSPRGDASLVGLYLSRTGGTDAAGQPLSVELIDGPVGLTVQADGLIEWSPGVAQLGQHAIELRFQSPSGSTQEVVFPIIVRQFTANSAPVIESTPIPFASAGQPYRYDLQVSDNDRDALSFDLLVSPDGMSIHPQLGTIRWTPTPDQVGTAQVVVSVTDPQGGSATQSFAVSTRRIGGPPRVTSVPPTEAAVGVGYLYSVTAVDAENDPLVYALVEAPEGMSIDSRSGEIAWTPTSEQLGQHAVIVSVADGTGGRTTQGFAIRVVAGLPNRPPVISTLPNLFATVGDAYGYTISATDPEGQPVEYLLRRGPEGMTIDQTLGVVDWIPTAGQVGRFVVSVVAVDPQGGASLQSFEVDVLGANTPPQIISTPPASVSAGATFQYDVVARDVDRDPIRYEFASAVPEGMTIDALGRIRWVTQPSDIGSVSIVVRSSDPRGGEATQTIEFEVVADTVAPRVTVLPSGGGWPWDRPVVVFVSAVDNVGVVDIELRVNDVVVPLDANRTARLLFDDWGPGVLNMVATARDAAGNLGSGAGVSFYRDPEIDYESGEGLPTALITTPNEDGTVVGMVEIRGTAAGNAFKEYRLSYARVDQLGFTEFVHNTTEVSDGLLGVWDTTLLENDAYVLRLEVMSAIGNTSVHDVMVGLSGELKLGNFRLSFEDMTIPVAGIPITIVRTYDTLRSDRDGDFGYGWRMEYRSTDLRTSLPKSGLEDLGIHTPFKPGTKVYLTLPGGQRQGFTFTPEIRVLPGFGRGNNLVLASPRFTPDRGNTSTLSAGGGQLLVNEFGELYASGGIPWNPAAADFGGGYTLTTADGVRYRIDGTTGLMQTATDRNGNTLTFTDAGITSSSGGAGIAIERDRFGRIASITDPAGNSLRYGYSATGDLIRIADRENHVTQIEYSTDRAHYLESIVDPLGREGIRSEYNQEGRLTSLFGGSSVSSHFTYDVNNQVIETRNADGTSTFTEYDERGNVVSITQPRGTTTRFAYDDAGNIRARTDALGATTRFAYDAAKNVVEITDALGNSTVRTFDRFRNMTTHTNPLGATMINQFDARGNLIESSDEEGAITTYLRDASGLIASITEPDGAKTAYTYDAFGRVASVTNALGATVSNEYDAMGRILQITSSLTLPSGVDQVALQVFQYNANGQTISITDANQTTTTYEYDAAGNEISSVDGLGNRTQYEHDSRGRLTQITLPNGAMTTYEYDSQDRMIATTDPLFRKTRFEYDANGQLVAEIYPDGTPNDAGDNPRVLRQYDAAGKLISETNELGHDTMYRYDLAGRIVEVIDAIGVTTKYTYDAAGQAAKETRADGVTLSYSYDRRGNRSAVVFPDGATTRYLHDHRGNVTQMIDALNHSTQWTYDLGGNLASVVDASGAATSYVHDALGRLVRYTDAVGNSTDFTYDLVGNLTTVDDPLGARTTHVFDSNGNLVSSTDPDDQIIEYSYDPLGQLVQRRYHFDGVDHTETFTYTLTGKRESTTDSRGTTTYRYDSQDRLLERTDPDGTSVSYLYDASGRLTQLSTLGGTDNFEHDAVGNLTRIVDSSGGITINHYDEVGRLVKTIFSDFSIQERAYDELGRLGLLRSLDADGGLLLEQRFTHNALGKRVAIDDSRLGRLTYSYDVLGRLTLEESPASRIGYTYDAVGNRLSRQHSEFGATLYEYGLGNRLVREIGSSGTRVFSYDGSGNLVLVDAGEGNQSEFSFDPLGRMTRGSVVDDVDPRVVHYVYDVDGDLVARSIDGEQTRFVVDDSSLTNRVAEVDQDGNVVARYLYDGLRRVGAIYSEENVAIHEGTVGGIRLVTSDGQAVGSFVYDAFGNPLESDGLQTSFGFGGGIAEHELELVGLRARFYDPAIGRFISVDPFEGILADPVSKHPYLYAHADPINVYDPSGMYSLGDVLTTISLVSFVASIGAIATGNDDLAWKLNILSVGTGLGAIGVSVAQLGIGLGRDILIRKTIADNARREAAELAARATAEGVTSAIVRETDLIWGIVSQRIVSATAPVSAFNVASSIAGRLNTFVLNLIPLERDYAGRWLSAKLLELSADATLTPVGRDVVMRVIKELSLTAKPFVL